MLPSEVSAVKGQLSEVSAVKGQLSEVSAVKGQLQSALMSYLGGRIDAADRKFSFILAGCGLALAGLHQRGGMPFQPGSLRIIALLSLLALAVAVIVAAIGQIGWFRGGTDFFSKMLRGKEFGSESAEIVFLGMTDHDVCVNWVKNLDALCAIVRWKTKLSNIALIALVLGFSLIFVL